MHKRLLVASVYAPSDRNNTWLGLQQRFLGETTNASYDFGVWLNRVEPNMFEEAGVRLLGVSDHVWGNMCQEHAFALNQLLEVFRASADDYDGFLILDSDAFPIQHNWLERLEVWMREDDFLPEKQFASACRTENLDTFPHPCCFYVCSSFLRDAPAAFNFTVAPHVNIAGYRFEDVGCGVPARHDERHVWLPLLRTNAWNPHPILSAIYGGVFYHHGAGSRPLEIRSVALRTYDNSFPRFQHGDVERQLFAEISRNPKLFVNQLSVARA